MEQQEKQVALRAVAILFLQEHSNLHFNGNGDKFDALINAATFQKCPLTFGIFKCLDRSNEDELGCMGCYHWLAQRSICERDHSRFESWELFRHLIRQILLLR